jgi:glycosyltransferase involved in cell wall biosynthesis
MRDFVHAGGLADKVVELQGVGNEDLGALYSSAVASLFPSLQEGFGWPIVEAQACGCPVFTSNRAPMTEVGGNAAVYFDPTQITSAADTIIQHLPRVQEMRQAGLENAKRFRTEAMIAGYVALYQTLCPGRAPVRMAAAYLSSETGG